MEHEATIAAEERIPIALTVAQVAQMLQVSQTVVYELIYAGKLRHFRPSPRRIRIPADALQEYIEQGCAEEEARRLGPRVLALSSYGRGRKRRG